MITQDQLLAIIRHSLTMIGGLIIMHGAVDAATWELVSGSVLGIAAIAWSIYDKNKKAKKIKEGKAAKAELEKIELEKVENEKPKKKLLKG